MGDPLQPTERVWLHAGVRSRAPTDPKPKGMVVLSGGQDSAVTALIARNECELLGAIHFEYGQRHCIEKYCAIDVAMHLGIPLFLLPINTFTQLGDSALLWEQAHVPIAAQHHRLKHLPASFVPGRNLIFLTFAAALLQKQGGELLYTGVCQTDYSGYPDCRQETVTTLELALRQGMDFPELQVRTPLMHLSKAQTFQLVEDAGELRLILEHTHTCYEGVRDKLHAWGYGCGVCPACVLRIKGWDEYQQQRAA